MQPTTFRKSPFSWQQARLWSLGQNAQFPLIQSALHIQGPLKKRKFQQSLWYLLHRHDILRRVFRNLNPSDGGLPLQFIASNPRCTYTEIDLEILSEIEQVALLDETFLSTRQEIFDLEQGPLIHARLFCLSVDSHVLIVSFSALCADAFTPPYFFSELCSLYVSKVEQVEPPPFSLQYSEASALQDELLAQEDAEETRKYWRRYDLLHLTSALLPFELETKSRQKQKTLGTPAVFPYQSLRKVVDPQVLLQLQVLAQRHNVTHSAILLACWQLLLWRLGKYDIKTVIGVIKDGRHYEEFTGALGPYARVVPFTICFDEDDNFQSIIENCDRVLQEIENYQTYFTWEQWPPLGHHENEISPFFRIGFESRHWPSSFQAGEITCSLLHLSGHIEPFVLKLITVETESKLWTEVHYDSNFYGLDRIECLTDCLHTLLSGALTHPQTPVSSLQVLSSKEQNRLLQLFSAPPIDIPAQPLHRLFETQVERTPDHLAVVSHLEQITYSCLNARANQLAHCLQQQGVKPSTLVGLCIERSANMLIGLLAILKAGGAYVPLEPSNPSARLNLLLTEAQVSLLITEEKLCAHFSAFSGHVMIIDGKTDLLVNEPIANLDDQCAMDDLAYVIYTSGSTGGPKAVMVQHRNVTNYSCYMRNIIAPREGLHFATISTLAADLGNTSIFCSLISGGCLHILSYDTVTSGEAFYEYMDLWPLDVLKMVPSHLKVLLATNRQRFLLPRLALVLGGEPFSDVLLEQLCQLEGESRCSVVNHYGPTETTIGALINVLGTCDSSESIRNRESWSTIPIGNPIANMQALILDRFGHIAPVGVAGELYLGGAGITLGYLNKPEQTQERFVPHPFSAQPDARLYKTGDLACYTSDGKIAFLGRIDNQIKLHGYRIELEEIETLLQQHPYVQQCAVLLKEEQLDTQRLVAYVVTHQSADVSTSDLRLFLSDYLPEYMIPSTFCKVDTLPLTPNGKVDRPSLREWHISETKHISVPQELSGARDMLEFELLQMWEEILNAHSIGVTDNFFDLGGHSFLAISLMSRIHRQFGQDVPLTALFQYPTVAELAVIMRQQTKLKDWPALVKIQGGASGLPLFVVHPAGGDVFCYKDLAHHLGTDQLVYGLQVPDGDGRKEYSNKVEEMAAHYIVSIRTVQPQGPYLIGGLSAGGIIAFEIAQQLQALGDHVALLALIDSRAPIPSNTPPISGQFDTSDAALAEIVLGRYDIPTPNESFYQLDPEEQLQYAMEQAKSIGTLPVDSTIEQFRRSLRKTVANIYAVNTYTPHVYSGQLTFFRAMEAIKDLKDADKLFLEKIRQSPTYGWDTLTTKEVKIHFVPGTHLELLNEPNICILAKTLKNCIDEIQK